jgi:hypothetical protein
MAETTLPVEHLFTLKANLRGDNPRVMNGPRGTRVVAVVTGGSFEGPKLRGTVDNSGGDWVTARADGSIQLDVRILLTTDDGAHIIMTYLGIGVPSEGGLKLRTAPLFETGDERYAWLNNVQAVATGTSAPGLVTYEVYALK